MSLPLYRQGLRSCYKIVLVVMAVLTLYVTVIITCSTPNSAPRSTCSPPPCRS